MNKLHHRLHRHIKHHLKLQQHKHTGKVLHHKHTSYRGIAVVLVLAGMVMVAATMVQRAAADALFGVYATVQAPVPTTSAVITTPDSGSTVQSRDTLVAGTCPIITPQVTVVLMVDGKLAGSAMCDGSNNFAMPVVLEAGAHTLVAQTYTTTQGQGPDSAPVQVTYRPAKAALAQTAAPILAPAASFTVLETDRTAAWEGTVTGGTAPYQMLIDWGDGKRNSYTITADSQHFTHHYGALRSYNARIAARDTTGQSVQQQYAVTSYASLANAPVAAAASTANPAPTLVAGLYGLFLTVLSVSCIIWLEAKHAARQEAVAA